jgi:pimeloyl-ACP methyl ester carboxylesterase
VQPDGSFHFDLSIADEPARCRYYPAREGAAAAVMWVFGAGGGWNGPAGGLYPRLGRRLTAEGAASLEVAYRYPGQLDSCVEDVLAGLEWLKEEGRARVALVGHSFGGAVVIRVAIEAPEQAAGVAALSSQSYGAQGIGLLRGRPVLLAHGTADRVLPDRCSRDLYRMAGEPKRLLLYPRCGHGLDECRDALEVDLAAWLRDVLALTPQVLNLPDK